MAETTSSGAEGGGRRGHKGTDTKEEDDSALGVCVREGVEGSECDIERTEVVLKDTAPRSKLTIEAVLGGVGVEVAETGLGWGG